MIKEILQMHKEALESLAHALKCPACNKIMSTKNGAYNLGPSFDQREGCKDCYEKIILQKS
jgi:hypothetical protein